MAEIREIIKAFRPELEQYENAYRDLHADPELSGCEAKTASVAAKHLQNLGFEVHEHIGGHGVVGQMRNGQGPVVMLRAELDALPIEEATGLPYASTKTMSDPLDNKVKPVMHACGHDMHIACMMATLDLLHAGRERWSGTLLIIFQPSEELLNGARSMIDDGLRDLIPKPDIILGQHCVRRRAGIVATRAGPSYAAADSFDIRVWGRGGHGAYPQECIDPILTASNIVVRLQSISSREIPPGEFLVVTCGSFHGGIAANIIPDFVDLKVDVRTYDPDIRSKALDSMKRIVKAETDASRCPKEATITRTRECPALLNDDAKTSELDAGFHAYFKDKIQTMTADGGSEDFAVFGTEWVVPYVFWSFGCIEGSLWDKAEKEDRLHEIPGNHSALFCPTIEPTLCTGMEAMSVAALTFLDLKMSSQKH